MVWPPIFTLKDYWNLVVTCSCGSGGDGGGGSGGERDSGNEGCIWQFQNRIEFELVWISSCLTRLELVHVGVGLKKTSLSAKIWTRKK